MITMNKIIYIVEGSTGEYSDHVEWPVAAYWNEDNAQQRVLKATQCANELFTDYRNHYGKVENEYDENMRMDYTGVRYRYYPIAIEDTDD